MEKYVFTVRLDDDVKRELESLCSAYGVSRNYLMSMLIRQEYNKIDSDPEIKKALEQINQLKSLIDKFNNDENIPATFHHE